MFEYLDTLFQDFSPLKLKVLNPILRQIIPFNKPHKISLVSMDENKAVAEIPYKRSNLNHIGGIHACGIATLGEFCAGMAITKNFPIIKYRPIMKNLSAEYHYQGKTNLKGESLLSENEVQRVKTELESADRSFIEMQTSVYDKDKNHVATVTTLWQIKSWKSVKTKL